MGGRTRASFNVDAVREPAIIELSRAELPSIRSMTAACALFAENFEHGRTAPARTRRGARRTLLRVGEQRAFCVRDARERSTSVP
jgi:hypothetical protein